jgi:hypothetical protein
MFEDSLVAAVGLLSIALTLALASQIALVKTVLNKYCLDAFWLIWICWVICQINHRLYDFLTITNVPAIVHSSLLATGFDIHSRDDQCIFRVC